MMMRDERIVGEPVDDARPSVRAMKAKRPFTGCISRFFQISAETVGMTKKGAIDQQARDLAAGEILVEQHGEERAQPVVMTSTEPTRTIVFHIASDRSGLLRRNL